MWPTSFLSIDLMLCREGGVQSTLFLHFQPLLLYFMSKQAQNLSHNKAALYRLQNNMPKHQNNALQKKVTINLKRVLFLLSVPHAWDTLDMSTGYT